MNIFKRKPKQIKYIVGQEYIVNLEDIKISEEFKKFPPRPAKLNDKYSNYYHNKHMDRIIIDINGTCCDGYTSLLIAKAFDTKLVRVLVR